jgi:hypothetical protein
VPYWNDIERISRRVKWVILHNQIGFTPDFGSRPFQTLQDVFSVRDAAAHGKPQTVSHEPRQERGEIEVLRRNKPLLRWEELANLTFAQRAFDDAGKVVDLTLAAAGIEFSDVFQRGYSYTISDVKERT